jgi:hypothetical protein
LVILSFVFQATMLARWSEEKYVTPEHHDMRSFAGAKERGKWQ